MIQTWFCNCPQYSWLTFRIDVEYIPSLHDPGKMLFSPKSTSLLSSFQIGSRFCFLSSQFYVIHMHRWIFFSRCTKRHSQFCQFSPIHVSIGLSQIAFPMIGPAKGWPYRFRSRGTTGSSILDHDFLPFVSWWTNPSFWTLRFCNLSKICEHLPFLLGYKQILRLLLVPRYQAIWRWYPWFLAPVIWDADDPCSVNTA